MRYFAIPLCFIIAGCSGGPKIIPEAIFDIFRTTPNDAVVDTPTAPATPVTVTPPPQRSKLALPPAVAPVVTPQSFGTTVASLGNVGETGLWLKTPLVKNQQQGILTAGNGQTVQVTLMPLPGPATGGSRISLAALQALGLPLTDLPELGVDPI
ncbi:MAG: hypothetical protein AAF701_04600 [Pseudomonadota bacterium]